ncbi:MAG: hypothetical protein ABIQ89_01925 [Candidatus Saccharimonadales bacterium]
MAKEATTPQEYFDAIPHDEPEIAGNVRIVSPILGELEVYPVYVDDTLAVIEQFSRVDNP